MLAVIKGFNGKNKISAGRCVTALLFNHLYIGLGKKAAVHPFVKSMLKYSIGMDDQVIIDKDLYIAQAKKALMFLISDLLKIKKIMSAYIYSAIWK